jgi:hypothetical protein
VNAASVPRWIHGRERPPRPRTRALLVVLEGFVGLGAVFGAYELLRDAEGFGLESRGLRVAPFPTTRFQGSSSVL